VIWVLIGAALLSLGLREYVDGVAILAIIRLNALLGFAQEYRSERAVAALAQLAAPRARVVHIAPLEILFQTEPTGAGQYALWSALGALPLAAHELQKWWRRRRQLEGNSRTSSGPR